MTKILLQKKQLRTTIIENRKNQKNQYEKKIYQNIKSVMPKQKNLTIALYLSNPTEPPTHYTIKKLTQKGHTIILPICQKNKTLNWAKYTQKTHFIPSKYTPTLEPQTNQTNQTTLNKAEIILVPALAIDYQGNRLGQGGGFYDKALSQINNSEKKIFGIIFNTEYFPQTTLPHDTQDIKVQGIITEKKIVLCETQV